MLDLKLIRTNPDEVKAAIHKRELNLDETVDKILEIDARRRELTGSTESMKAEQNACTKKIPHSLRITGSIMELSQNNSEYMVLLQSQRNPS